MPGALLAPVALRATSRTHASKSPQVEPRHRHSLRNGFNGLCRALPGDEFLLSPSSANWLLCETRLGLQDLRRLDTSNGCQDHTTSPSATPEFVFRKLRVHRIPPRVRDDREPPLLSGETAKSIA